MNDPRQRAVELWLDAGPDRGSDEGLARALDGAFTVPQRSGWATTERWLSAMQLTAVRPGARVPRALVLLAIVALLVAGVVAAIAVGSRRHVPPPLGFATNGLMATDTYARISLMAPDGSSVHALTPTTEADLDPVWSPDGQHLAFYSWPPVADGQLAGTFAAVGDGPIEPTGSVVVVDADGGHRTVIAHGLVLSTGALLPPTWSHDSSRIAFSHIDAGTPTIEVARLDGAPIARIPGGDAATWSPDDTMLAYRSQDRGVFVVAADGFGKPRWVSTTGGSGFAFTLPQWSPDGTQLAYYDGSDGGHDIRVARLDGTGEVGVDETAADEYWPFWSPDGSRLAFMRVINNDNEINYVVANADGSNPRMFAMQPLSGQPGGGWSPDGRLLVGYVPGVDANNEVLLIDASTGSIASKISSPTNVVAWQRTAP